jgi:anti-anti-sigma factor
MTVAATSSTGIKVEGFSAQSERVGANIVVSLRGNADMAVHDRLKKYLDDLHDQARVTRAKEAVFEIQELYFMNSTCLSLLLRFINGVSAGKPGEQYKLRFRSNPNLRWQKKSLDALRAYAEDLVVIE